MDSRYGMHQESSKWVGYDTAAVLRYDKTEEI